MNELSPGEKVYLRLEDVPFMHWGIITKYNFSQDKIRLIPRKKWDPLAAAPITLPDSSGKMIPIGKWKGHFSYISPIRGVRPGEGGKEGKPKDVFKEIIEGRDYAIFVTINNEKFDGAFSAEPLMFDIRDARAATIVNRYPSMVRVIDEDLEPQLKAKIEDKYTKIAHGINLVAFPVSEYYETFSEANVNSLTCLLNSMSNAIKISIEDARKKGYTLIPVYVFFNIGPLAGGTQPRLHAQVYLDLNQDGHGAFMENVLQAFDTMKENCHICSSRHDNRVVFENNTWIAWATSAPRRNFHVRIAPKRHVEKVTELDEGEMRGLSETLIKISKAMDRAGVARDRYVLIYSNPVGYNSFFHMFIDFVPFESIGGIEILDSVRVARITPEDVAVILRKALEVE